MTPETYIQAQVARYAIEEAAHYGGVDNMAAVAHVLRNRVYHGWYAGEWMPVIEEAPSKVGTIVAVQPVNLRDMAIRLLLSRIGDIVGNREPDMVSDALFYCELHNVNRDWFRKHILDHLDQHPRVATVGPVAFFK